MMVKRAAGRIGEMENASWNLLVLGTGEGRRMGADVIMVEVGVGVEGRGMSEGEVLMCVLLMAWTRFGGIVRNGGYLPFR
jgi:hypothetical protein